MLVPFSFVFIWPGGFIFSYVHLSVSWISTTWTWVPGYSGSSLGRQGDPEEIFRLPFLFVNHAGIVTYNLTALLCTFINHSGSCLYVFLNLQLLSCAPFTRIIAITYSQCGSWEVPWRETYSYIWTHLIMLLLKEGLENPFFYLPSYLLIDLYFFSHSMQNLYSLKCFYLHSSFLKCWNSLYPIRRLKVKKSVDGWFCAYFTIERWFWGTSDLYLYQINSFSVILL